MRTRERAATPEPDGFADANAFDAALAAHRDAVERHFDAVFGEEAGAHDDDPLATVWVAPAPEDAQCATLAAAGYGDSARAARDAGARRGNARATCSCRRCRAQRFDTLVPQLLRAAASAAETTGTEPEPIFLRLLALLETISGRSAYLALLVEHPPILPRLAQLMGASSWAADYLMRHPILLDELLDSRALLAEPDWDAWRQRARCATRDACARCGAADGRACGTSSTRRSFACLPRTWRDCSASSGWPIICRCSPTSCSPPRSGDAGSRCRARREPPFKFAIIGYGKLGGKELGYASDLDLVFLYDDPDRRGAASDTHGWRSA